MTRLLFDHDYVERSSADRLEYFERSEPDGSLPARGGLEGRAHLPVFALFIIGA
jgi:hypothetical protein